MALTLGNATTITVAARDAQANGFEALLATGGGTAQLILRDGSATTLVTFSLANAPFGASSSGVITLASTPISATASAGTAATVSSYVIKDRGGTIQWTGSVTGSDTITSGQTVNLTSLTITWPAS